MPVLKYLVALFCLPVINLCGQSWQWAHDANGIGTNVSNAITVDESGNSYVTGHIDGSATFGGTNYQGHGVYDVFIAKYDPQGSLQWVELAGGDGNDAGTAIRYQSGYLYISGSFEDTAYFGNSSVISNGDGDAFVAKYDVNGNFVWVKSAGGAAQDAANTLDIDNSGNVYIAGSYMSSMTIGSIHFTTANLYSESFYAKYDNNGNLLWAKSSVGNNTNLITGMAFDHTGAVYLTGFFSGSFKLDTTAIQSQSPSYNILLAKIDGNGALQWIKRAGGYYEDAAEAVCADNAGNAIVTGYFSGTAYFGNDSVVYDNFDNVFVAKYDSSGNNLWVKAGKGPLVDIAFAVATNSSNDIFVTGIFQDSINFSGAVLTCPIRQVFAVCYRQNGDFRWATQAGGTQTASGLGIAVANSGVVIVTGYYQFNCTFGTISLDIAQSSAYDIFIASLTLPQGDGIFSIDNPGISLYPNPVRANAVLAISSPDFTGTAEVVIRNSLGQILKQDKLFEKQFVIPDLCPGVYYISISNAEKNGTAKIVVE